MSRYVITEESEDSGFEFLFYVLLFSVLLPIGAIWLLVKVIMFISKKRKENQIHKHTMYNNRCEELNHLEQLRSRGLITDDEFKTLRSRAVQSLIK